MEIEIKVPKLGLTIESVSLSKWEKEDGETVAEGDVIATIEADKATNEITAPVSGTLVQLAQEGEEIPVGELIARIKR